MGCCGGKKTKQPVKATAVTKAVNFSTFLAKSAVGMIKGDDLLIDISSQILRLQYCRACPYRNDRECTECGCDVGMKSAMAKEDCPKGNWPKRPKPGE